MKQFNKVFPWLVLAGVLINANGLFNNILEPDGALYATISKRIAITNDWFNLWALGSDWLDKPHFQFWVTALSFKILGISYFSYKLPAFLFWLAGIFFTYKLAKDLYDTGTARVAVVLYIFALHGVLNNFDVRAEPYLTTLTIAAIYFFYKAHLSKGWHNVILAALMAAFAVMTKGIFVLLTIGGGFIVYWLLNKQYKQFINYRWYVLLLLIFLFTVPELYSLYVQFDMHPEKIVFGRTNVSGIQFFFWDSQFGRFFNTGPITGRGDVTFFIHSTLWAFLPWSLLLVAAVIYSIKNLNKKSYSVVIGGSAALTFLLFSLSKFQLPHYIVILFPHFSILTSRYLVELKQEKIINRWKIVQLVLLLLGAVLVVFLCVYTGFGNPIIIMVSAIIGVILGLYLSKDGINRIIIPSTALILVLFFYLHNFFYPELLQYQSGVAAGKWIEQNKPGNTTALINAPSAFSFEFNAPGLVYRLNNDEALHQFVRKNPSAILYVSEKELSELSQQGYHYKILKTFPYFHISMLTGDFLNPNTRSNAVETVALIEIDNNAETIQHLKQKMMEKLINNRSKK